jgi:hypothetical protein
MHEMTWSWDEFQATPLYVRRYCLDLISIRRRVAAEKADQRNPGGPR